MTHIDAEQLLVKLNSGKSIPDDNIAEIAAFLEEIAGDPAIEDRVSFDEVYNLILVLGRAKATAYRNLVARYLEIKDPLTAALALEILCLEWNGLEEYIEQVFHFALGVSWDEDDDLSLMAIKVLGEYLHIELSQNNTLPAIGRSLELLLFLFEDKNGEQWVRQAAYVSLLRAAGYDWEQVPSECAMLNLEKGSDDIDWSVVNQSREKLSKFSVISSSSSNISSRPAI
jgi:hypothetical protein